EARLGADAAQRALDAWPARDGRMFSLALYGTPEELRLAATGTRRLIKPLATGAVLAAASGPQADPMAPAADRARALSGLCLLVADDNPLNREVASGMLTRAGAEVDFAADGRIALDKVVSQPDRYHAVLTDVQM